jgi:hypothetical protein
MKLLPFSDRLLVAIEGLCKMSVVALSISVGALVKGVVELSAKVK